MRLSVLDSRMKKQEQMKCLLAAVVFSAVLAACNISTNPPAPGPPQLTATNTPAFIVVPQLTNARSILIEDSWSGLNSVAPIEARYILELKGVEFEGQAEFSVGGYRRDPLTSTEQIIIPGEAAQTFLKELSGLPLTLTQVGYHTPICCDNYPSARIEVVTESATIVFRTNSHVPAPGKSDRTPGSYTPLWHFVLEGGSRLPWFVTIQHETYLVNSDHPAMALTKLNTYLKKDVLAQLINEHETR